MQQLLLILMLFFASFGEAIPQQDSITEPKKEIRYDHSSALEQINFDDKKIESYKTAKDFDYLNNIEEDSWWTRFKRWINSKYQNILHWLFGEYEANAILLFIFGILPYLLLGLLLAITTYLFIRLSPGPTVAQATKTPAVFLNEEEKIIQSPTIRKLIKEAITNGQHRLAVRYFYLEKLQKLNDRGIISYQYQKTNEDYTSEIGPAPIKEQFKKITRFYNFIWYGDFGVSESDFKLAEKEFKEMDRVLNNKTNE